MPSEFDVKMICEKCKSCYLRDHPNEVEWLKCGLCGYCKRKIEVRAAVEDALKAKNRVIH